MTNGDAKALLKELCSHGVRCAPGTEAGRAGARIFSYKPIDISAIINIFSQCSLGWGSCVGDEPQV